MTVGFLVFLYGYIQRSRPAEAIGVAILFLEAIGYLHVFDFLDASMPFGNNQMTVPGNNPFE